MSMTCVTDHSILRHEIVMRLWESDYLQQFRQKNTYLFDKIEGKKLLCCTISCLDFLEYNFVCLFYLFAKNDYYA